jgi:fucose permease
LCWPCFYVGVEVIAGDTIINYGSSLGIPLSSAFLASCTLGLMLAGYVTELLLSPIHFTVKDLRFHL